MAFTLLFSSGSGLVYRRGQSYITLGSPDWGKSGKLLEGYGGSQRQAEPCRVPRGTVLKAEEAARSWSERNEKQGQHRTPPKSLRACDGPAVGTRTGQGRAAKGQCGFTGRRGKGHDPKSISRASCGGVLWQNVTQSKGKASLDTGASPSARPHYSIRWGKESKRRRNTGESRTRSKPLPRLPPGPQPGDRTDHPCETGCGAAEAALARPEPAAPGGFTSAGLGLSWSPWRRSVHV